MDSPDACAVDPCDEPRYVGLLCRKHYHRLQAALHQVEALYAILPWEGPSGAPSDDSAGRSATRVHSDAPGSLYAMALTDSRAVMVPGDNFIPDVPGTLASWATMVAEQRAPQHDGWSPTVAESIRMLGQHRLWVAQQDWAPDLIADVDTCHRHLARATGGGMWPVSVGECPDCGLRLYRGAAEPIVVCGHCRARWTPADLWRAEILRGEAK